MIIKLIEKKDKYKRLIQNWRPKSLLYIDLKILSKGLADCIKKHLFSYFIKSASLCRRKIYQQSGRLFSDILQVTDFLKLRGLTVTVDIQRTFDSVNHLSLNNRIKKIDIGKTFIKWIQILLRNQKSFKINGGTTIKYFKVEKSTRIPENSQGDPNSVIYLFLFMK